MVEKEFDYHTINVTGKWIRYYSISTLIISLFLFLFILHQSFFFFIILLFTTISLILLGPFLIMKNIYCSNLIINNNGILLPISTLDQKFGKKPKFISFSNIQQINAGESRILFIINEHASVKRFVIPYQDEHPKFPYYQNHPIIKELLKHTHVNFF